MAADVVPMAPHLSPWTQNHQAEAAGPWAAFHSAVHVPLLSPTELKQNILSPWLAVFQREIIQMKMVVLGECSLRGKEPYTEEEKIF